MKTGILSYMMLGLFYFFIGIELQAQPHPIGISNPSFEDVPQHSKPPIGWFYCGPAGESPPDVHPSGMFNVSHEAFDGETYVGMVTRDNETWEGLGQRLDRAMRAYNCYSFSIYATRSSTYSSHSKMTGQPAQYIEPVVLRIWGGNYNCEEKELLAVSKKVLSEEWKSYTFLLKPQSDHTHFFIEAFYNNDGNTRAYNGNVLIDNASPLIPAACDTGTPLLEIEHLHSDESAYDVLLDMETFKDILIIEGQQIKFDRLDELEKHLVSINQHSVQYINKHLWKIAEALKRAPGQKLIIAVTGDNPYAVLQRQSNIEALFEKFNLAPSRFKFKEYKKRGKARDWLWHDAGASIYIRLY